MPAHANTSNTPLIFGRIAVTIPVTDIHKAL